jgi:hypothetical protein
MLKKLATAILVLALFSLFTITPAQAGDKQRNIWKGAGIALGAVALGGLLAYSLHALPPPPPPHVVYSPPPDPYEERQTPGHYEDRRVWVEGYYRSY